MKLNTRKIKKLRRKIENKVHNIYKEGKPTFLSMMNFESGLSEEDHTIFVSNYIARIMLGALAEIRCETPIPFDLYITWDGEKQTHFFKVEQKEESIFMDDLSCMERVQPHYQNN
jgi:hypothetical protein